MGWWWCLVLGMVVMLLMVLLLVERTEIKIPDTAPTPPPPPADEEQHKSLDRPPNIDSDEIIHSDQMIGLRGVTFVKADYFHYGPFMWRGSLHNPDVHAAKVVVCGQSDLPLTSEIVRRYPNVHRWYSTNNLSGESRVTTLPLGITNDSHDAVLGDRRMMVEVAREPAEPRVNLAYMNFSTKTHSSRPAVWEAFKGCSWVTAQETVDRRVFLQQLRRHRFCIAPRGNGLDTHRLWEALYMGCIPVTEWNESYADFSDLPVIFVRSWPDVSETMLNQMAAIFEKRSWNWEKLKWSYWRRIIEAPPPPAFVLVHLGSSPLPDHAVDCVRALLTSNPETMVYIVCDTPVAPWADRPGLKIIWVDSKTVPVSAIRKTFLATHRFNWGEANGLAVLSCLRLFVLHDLMEHFGLRDVVHIEYDNLIYFNMHKFVSTLRSVNAELAAPRYEPSRLLANVLYVHRPEALKKFLQYVVDNPGKHAYEMHYLGSYVTQPGSNLVELPTTPETLGIWEDVGIFDAAPLGQCLSGTDPKYVRTLCA